MGQGCILESLRKFLSSGLRQEEGGESSKERAEAENEKREDRRELGEVDHLTMIFIITWTLPSGSMGHRGREATLMGQHWHSKSMRCLMPGACACMPSLEVLVTPLLIPRPQIAGVVVSATSLCL